MTTLSPADLRTLISTREQTDSAFASMVTARNDNGIAAALSVGRVQTVQTLGGIGFLMRVLGPDAGAAMLDALSALSATNSAVKWAMTLINAGTLDFGDPNTQTMMDQLSSADPAHFPAASVAALKAACQIADPISTDAVSYALNGGN